MIINNDIFFNILIFIQPFIQQNILNKKIICLEIYFLKLINKYYNKLVNEYLIHYYNYRNVLNEKIDIVKTIYWNEIGLIGNEKMFNEIQNFQIIEKNNYIIMNACIYNNLKILLWIKNNKPYLFNENIIYSPNIQFKKKSAA